MKRTCEYCKNEFEGYKNTKYCSVECSFHSKDYVIDPETDCWNWTAGTAGRGYGLFNFNSKKHLAHRVACELAHGPAPSGKNFVLHSCDNPKCINTDHLRWGSPQENMDDKVKRNRQTKGEKTEGAKLKETDVIDIKQKLKNYARGDMVKIAKEYNVSDATIRDIKKGITWKHI